MNRRLRSQAFRQEAPWVGAAVGLGAVSLVCKWLGWPGAFAYALVGVGVVLYRLGALEERLAWKRWTRMFDREGWRVVHRPLVPEEEAGVAAAFRDLKRRLRENDYEKLSAREPR